MSTVENQHRRPAVNNVNRARAGVKNVNEIRTIQFALGCNQTMVM